MTDQAMSPLRRRMIEDMTIRKFAQKTQQGYIRTIKNLAAFIGRSPDKASFEGCADPLAARGAGAGAAPLSIIPAEISLRLFRNVHHHRF
jgi:integrase/recombinase XerD